MPELAPTGFFGGVSTATGFSFSCDEGWPKLNAADPDPNAIPELAVTVLFGASFSSGEAAVFPKEKVPMPPPGATVATGDFAPNIGIDDDGVEEGDPNEPNRFAGGPDFSAGFSGSGLFVV